MEQDAITLDLRALWGLVKKNIVLILLLTSFGCVGTFLVSKYLVDPQYEAAVTLVVNTRIDQTTIVTTDQINSARQLANTYAVILTNDTLLEDIIIQLGLSDTIVSLRKRITTEAVNQTQVLQMTVRDRNPRIAIAVLSEIMAQAQDLLTSSVKAGSVEIVSPPRINYDPVSPRVALNTAIGTAAGLFLALLIVFIRKALANTFVSDEDVSTHLGLPILGVIPSLNSVQETRIYGRK